MLHSLAHYGIQTETLAAGRRRRRRLLSQFLTRSAALQSHRPEVTPFARLHHLLLWAHRRRDPQTDSKRLPLRHESGIPRRPHRELAILQDGFAQGQELACIVITHVVTFLQRALLARLAR